MQSTPLLYASANGHAGAVQVLVDSKADLEARNEVAMWPEAWCLQYFVVVVMMQSIVGQWYGV